MCHKVVVICHDGMGRLLEFTSVSHYKLTCFSVNFTRCLRQYKKHAECLVCKSENDYLSAPRSLSQPQFADFLFLGPSLVCVATQEYLVSQPAPSRWPIFYKYQTEIVMWCLEKSIILQQNTKEKKKLLF